MSGDRVGSDEFRITQDFLAQMLGSQRSTVTLSARLLQTAGLIRYHRGRVTIVDRDGLEEVSCECYGVIRALFDSRAPEQRRRSASRRRNVRSGGLTEVS
jgi:DNA-binding GntR family transcriptional regulator